MRLRQIEINNFRSFAGKHQFDFYRGKSGLYFVTGQNKLRPKLGANGVGKTGLFEAVHWCFYGKTSRNVRGSHVVNWDHTGGCSVMVVFKRAGHEYMVRRSHKPNQLTLAIDHGSAENIDQPDLDTVLGCDEVMFKHTAYLSQFGKTFFDLKNDDRLAIFSQIMKLDIWLDYSRQAAEVVKEKEESRTKFAAQIEAFEIRQRELADVLKQIKREESEFRDSKKAKICEAKDECNDCRKRLSKAEGESKKLAALLEQAKISITKAQRIGAKHDKVEKLISQRVAESSRASVEADERLATVRKQYRRLKNMGDECPVCLQEVEPGSLEKHRRELKRQLIRRKKNSAHALRTARKFAEDLAEVQAESEKADKAIRNLETLITTTRNDKQNHQDELERLKAELERANKKVLEAKSLTNPYAKIKEQQEKQVELTATGLQETQAKLARAIEGHKIHSYWVTGFKQIRLKLIDQALREFEVEINAALDDLGMGDYIVTLDIERETKAGTISRGFQLFITPPGQSTPVPWETWSGGETQRLLLAGVMGLIGLVSGRTGIQTGFEIWDEPSHHLSGRGIDYLLAALETRAQRLRKQVWLIDHHTLEYGGFTNVTNVVLDKDGSHLEIAA